VSGVTKLDQIIDQLCIKERDYLYWSSKEKFKLVLPPSIYVSKLPQFSSGGDSKNKSGRAKSLASLEESKEGQESLLNTKDPKMLLTYDTLFLFFLESRKDQENQFNITSSAADKEDDLNQERIDMLESMNEVQVRDVQQFSLQDFEFIQKLQQPKRSFILRLFNKQMTNQEMPYIQIECSKD